jgi:hypothetical protein
MLTLATTPLPVATPSHGSPASVNAAGSCFLRGEPTVVRVPYNYRATLSTRHSQYYSAITMTASVGNGAAWRGGATKRLR